MAILVKGAADQTLEKSGGAAFHWLGLGELSRAVRLFREAGVESAILAGRVRHVNALQILKPDKLTLKVLGRLRSSASDTLLKTVAGVLAEEGIALLDSTVLMREQMATAGPMTKRKPKKDELENARFGAAMARGLAGLDIGQTVVVKKMAVVAAEAMEGTDAAIRRAGELTGGPFVVVKVARPRQDMRFDVPVVGPGTIDSMAAAGATALGLEAERVLLLDRDDLLHRANAAKIAVFGVERAGGE